MHVSRQPQKPYSFSRPEVKGQGHTTSFSDYCEIGPCYYTSCCYAGPAKPMDKLIAACSGGYRGQL